MNLVNEINNRCRFTAKLRGRPVLVWSKLLKIVRGRSQPVPIEELQVSAAKRSLLKDASKLFFSQKF